MIFYQLHKLRVEIVGIFVRVHCSLFNFIYIRSSDTISKCFNRFKEIDSSQLVKNLFYK